MGTADSRRYLSLWTDRLCSAIVARRLLLGLLGRTWQELARRQLFGAIESKKAESDLFAPTAGKLIEINSLALNDPSVINADMYGDGWLLAIEVQDRSDLLEVDGYVEHLTNAWEVAQRTIKGQI